MKFTIKKDEFLKTLLQVGKIIPLKHTNPIFVNVRLDLKADKLTLTGSNGDLSIYSSIPFFKDDKEIIRDTNLGSILVNNSILTDIARKIDGDEITFEILEDNVARIESNDTSFKLNCVNADEYIDLDFSFQGVEIEVEAKDIIDVVSQVAFAASLKNTKPILTGVNFEGTGTTVNFVATDGARLAKKEIKANCKELFSTTIPTRTLQEIAKSITNEKTIMIYINDKRILARLDNTVICSTLLAGNYPNIKNIIPKNFFYTLEVNSLDMIKAIETANVFSSTTGEKGVVIRVIMTENEITLTCNSVQNGSSNVNLKLFKYTGGRLEMNFNSDYVLNAIKALKCEELIMSFQGEMKPFTITNVESDGVIQLLTPVRGR